MIQNDNWVSFNLNELVAIRASFLEEELQTDQSDELKQMFFLDNFNSKETLLNLKANKNFHKTSLNKNKHLKTYNYLIIICDH